MILTSPLPLLSISFPASKPTSAENPFPNRPCAECTKVTPTLRVNCPSSIFWSWQRATASPSTRRWQSSSSRNTGGRTTSAWRTAFASTSAGRLTACPNLPRSEMLFIYFNPTIITSYNHLLLRLCVAFFTYFWYSFSLRCSLNQAIRSRVVENCWSWK